MSKYDPLRLALEREPRATMPMRFDEVEQLLGFPLPASARRHQPWWANTGGSHVHAEAWLKAGWRATGVDLGRERVTFVRQHGAGRPTQPTAEQAPGVITIKPAELSPLARDFLARKAGQMDGDYASAVRAILNDTPMQERKRILGWFAARSPKVAGDSADLIRADRDER